MEVEMAGAILRAKMSVSEVTHSIEPDGSVGQEKIKLQAVYTGSDENRQWSKFTPSANFEIWINNPDAHNKLSKGHEYYVDFIPAEAAPPEE
jgi:hypothetical protein